MDNKGLALLNRLMLVVDKLDSGLELDVPELREQVLDYVVEQCTRKCAICAVTILNDESYIQNCDGVQHIRCYMNSLKGEE